jgi:hypothetical protein
MGEASFWHGDVKRALDYLEGSMALIEKHSSIDYRAIYGIDLEMQLEILRSLAEVVTDSPGPRDNANPHTDRAHALKQRSIRIWPQSGLLVVH